jgi:tol-pal system protein YbgF
MRFTQSWLAVGALVVAGALPVDSLAKPSLEERIDHLEHLLENKVTIEVLNDVEALKAEMQELRGKLDEQHHATEVLTQRQEKLFLDLEQRIGQLPKNSATPQFADKHATSSSSYVIPAPPKVEHSLPSVPVKPVAKIENKLPQAKPKEIASNGVEIRSLTEEKNTNGGKASSEQEAYNAAYKLVDTKHYQEALVAFKDFLWQFPDGQYAANANYWLGEIYLSQWHSDRTNKANLDNAINSFKTVIAKYARHHKAADSLLKLGIIEADRDNLPAAKEYFTQLKQQYPGSSRAHMADMRLKNLK